MALSTGIGFIQPKEVEVITYGDFIGSDKKFTTADSPEFPLNLKKEDRFNGCMLVLFSSNSVATDLLKELLNSFNTQLSGIPYKLGYVDLTQDRRIVDNIINTTRIANSRYKNFIPPYFIMYVNSQFRGFFNPPAYQVTAILDKLRNTPDICTREDSSGIDNVNTFPFIPQVNFAVTSQQRTGDVFNVSKQEGVKAYQRQQEANVAYQQQQEQALAAGTQIEEQARRSTIPGVLALRKRLGTN